MKKLFATLLMLSNMFPALAYVRDDTDSGFGFLGGDCLFCDFYHWNYNLIKKSRQELI